MLTQPQSQQVVSEVKTHNLEWLFGPLLALKGSMIEIDSKLQQRGIADILESTCVDRARKLYGDFFVDRSSNKSTEDFILNIEGITYIIDVKSHDIDKTFSMPNLTAIEVLRNIYQTTSTVLFYLLIDYKIIKNDVLVTDVHICAPHHISWDSLQIANLGRGQLQIKCMRDLKIDYTQSAPKWFATFVSEVIDFKYNLIDKLTKSLELWYESA